MPRIANGAAAAAAILALSVVGCALLFPPTARDYRFEAVDAQVRPSRDAEVRVRLVHVPDNRPVGGAAITEHRFTMLMPHQKMTTTLMVEGADPSPVLAVDEGDCVYRVHAQLPMPGDWRATLTARVPGEALPVRGTVPVRVQYR